MPPIIDPVEWHDTAALSTYLQAPRNLEGASRELLGKEPDKSIREEMKGFDWQKAKELLKDSPVTEYALEDAKLACKLWLPAPLANCIILSGLKVFSVSI